jgi:hypothetical protein
LKKEIEMVTSSPPPRPVSSTGVHEVQGVKGTVARKPPPQFPSSKSQLRGARPPSSASSSSGSSVEVVDRGTSPTRPPSSASSTEASQAAERGVVAESTVTEEVVAEGAAEEGAVVAGASVAEAATSAIPVVDVLVAIGGIAAGVVAGIIGNDNNKREAYTQQFVAQASKQYPNCNHVVCHPQHRVAGPQVVHTHYELGMTAGTCGYDIYSSPMGQPFIFENQGDGGYLNWAYAGQFSRNGNTLTAASKLPTPKFS